MCDTANEVFIKKVITLNACMTKENTKIYNQSSDSRKLEEIELFKPIPSKIGI